MRTLPIIALCFLASISFSQNANKQDLTQSFWVENTELSSADITVFDAQTSFTKNTSVPYSIHAFKLEANSTGMFYDWGVCNSITPLEAEKGSWTFKQNKLTITTSICKKEIEIISITNEQLIVKINR